MKKGGVVKFRHPVDADEGRIRMILLEDPDGGRVLVQDLLDMPLPPTHVYPVDSLCAVENDNASAN